MHVLMCNFFLKNPIVLFVAYLDREIVLLARSQVPRRRVGDIARWLTCRGRVNGKNNTRNICYVYDNSIRILGFSIAIYFDAHNPMHPALTQSLIYQLTRLLRHLDPPHTHTHTHSLTHSLTHPTYIQHQRIVLGQVPSRPPLAAVQLVRRWVPMVAFETESRPLVTTGMQLLAACVRGIMHMHIM